jgi:hypothetical protein
VQTLLGDGIADRVTQRLGTLHVRGLGPDQRGDGANALQIVIQP